MSADHTPVQSRSNTPGFYDISNTIIRPKRRSEMSSNTQAINNNNNNGGAIRKRTDNTEAGEAGATSLLRPEERIAWQMEEALTRLAESMAKIQFTFQEKLNKENGIWRREIEQLIKEKNKNIADTHQSRNSAATARTAQAQETARDNTPLRTLRLTPPTVRPNIPAQQPVQRRYPRNYTSEHDSTEEEYIIRRRGEPRRDTMRTQTRMPHSHNIQLDRWGISFEGDDDKVPVEEFIFRIEHLQQLHDVPWNVIMGDFHKILKGRAQDWYWMHLRTNSTQSWYEFKAAMIKQFKTHRNDFDIMKMLVERKQRYNEDIDDFIHHMRKLHARLSQPREEKELVNIVKSNMSEEVAKILYPMDIRTLPELSKEYHKAQRIFVRRRNYQMPTNNYVRPSRPAVSEIATRNMEPSSDEEREIPEEEQMIDEIRRPAAKCWNCQEVGHTYMDCSKARTIFCYKCGRPQTITPKCPKCNPGNRQRSTNEASGSSSHLQQQQQQN